MKFKKTLILIFAIFLLVSKSGFSQENAYQGEVAVEGYDITSYFGDDLLKGDKKIQTTHEGVIYYFANEVNLNKFKDNPEKFIPAYGGWCAMALCQDKLVQPNPKLFSIIDNKLHLFEVKVFYNGKAEWSKDPDKHKALADQKYQKILTKEKG